MVFIPKVFCKDRSKARAKVAQKRTSQDWDLFCQTWIGGGSRRNRESDGKFGHGNSGTYGGGSPSM